jgi:hypothetical protein
VNFPSLIFAAACLGAAALPAVAASPILPGYWESQNHSDLLISQSSTDRKCLTKAQVESYLSGPVNNHYACVYDHRSIADGAVHLSGQCIDNNGIKVKVAIAGTYTSESFHLTAQLQTHLATLPITGSASTDAHRLSAECPVPAPRPPDAAAGN